MAIVKLINMALHLMYDEAQIISENNLKQGSNSSGGAKTLRETSDENGSGGAIEMQVLDSAGAAGGGGAASNVRVFGAGVGASGAISGGDSSIGLGQISLTGVGETNTLSNELSLANSALSIEFAEQPASTMGKKAMTIIIMQYVLQLCGIISFTHRSQGRRTSQE